MARDLNKIQIIGHLGADPAMRFTTQGTAVTTFRVAANYGDETEWFRVVAWENLGEICNQYLTKGTRVYVEGRLQTRKWQDRDGQERSTTEVVANEMIILSSKGDPSVEEPVHAAPPPQQRTEPAQTPPATRRSRRGIVTDEDLPL